MTTAADAADAARVAAVIARVPGWAGRARVVRALSGGITNRNHLVDVDGDQYVVRLPGADTELLEIDRECERIAASRAGALGLAPAVLGLFDGCLVTRFVEGTLIEDADFAAPATLGQIAEMLAAVHAGAPLPRAFDGFAVPRLHRDAARRRGVTIPAEYEPAAAAVAEIAMAFSRAPEPTVPCHNDLGRGNFLRDSRRIWLLDWEYAGMNNRWFDLGNIAVMNHLSPAAEEHLVVRYRGRATAADFARLRLMKIVSDAREAMWGVVQGGISTLDFDYGAYAAEHFDRLLAHASTGACRTDLVTVAETA